MPHKDNKIKDRDRKKEKKHNNFDKNGKYSNKHIRINLQIQTGKNNK